MPKVRQRKVYSDQIRGGEGGLGYGTGLGTGYGLTDQS